jgi:SAM-dependent methyltransferase
MATAAPERPYDRLVSRFGVMFFADPAAAFANLVRWLVPGGRFAFAVWGPLAKNAWMATVRDEVARHVDLPVVDPDAPGPFRYAEASRLLALLDRAGFTRFELLDWQGTLPLGGGLSAPAAAKLALTGFSNFAELLAPASAEARDEALRALTARFEGNVRDGVVRLDACVHLVTGMR